MSLDAGPIFLVGCPRSGTTLLQRLLDAHREIAIAPETFFVRHFWKKRRRYEEDFDPDGRARLIAAFAETAEFHEMGFDAERLADAIADAPDVATAFGRVLDRFAATRGVRRVGEKTPNHLLAMRTLEKLYPEARFLHIVRDPRAVVDSWSRVPWSNGRAAWGTLGALSALIR